jgi:hypothetical protein
MRAKISIDIESMIDDIGVRTLVEKILFFYPDALQVFVGNQSTLDLAYLLRKTMSPEALTELKAALG